MADSGYPIGIISIHALHEESDYCPVSQTECAPISIHALHEESDWNNRCQHCLTI